MTKQNTFYLFTLCFVVVIVALLYKAQSNVSPAMSPTTVQPTVIPLATATISSTGADLRPLPVDQSTIINETAKLRLALPVTTDRFSMSYDLDENNFKVTLLQEGVSKEEVFSWVRSQGLQNIPAEKFVF